MAKVIIVGSSSNYTVLTEILTELDYEVVFMSVNSSVFTVENILLEGMPGKDVAMIILSRFSSSTYTSFPSVVVALNLLGYVFSLSGMSSTAGSAHISNVIGLHSGISSSSLNNLNIVSDDSFLSEESLSNSIVINNISNRYISEHQLTPFAKKLIVNVQTTTVVHSFYLPPNTTSLTGYNLVAPIFYIDLLHDLQSTAKSPMTNFMRDVLEYSVKSTKPPYLVNGTVTDVAGDPLQRELSIYSVRTKKLLNTGQSDELSGEYSIGVYKEEPVFVVMNPFGFEKPDIHYNIVPEDNPDYI